MTVRIQSPEQVEQVEQEAAQAHMQNVTYEHSDYDEAQETAEASVTETQAGGVTVRNTLPKVGRNEPCPCGSGKKYKACHGKIS
jgi:preprotein translocase subunit SecA